MNVPYEFILRAVAGESFLVPIGAAAKKFPGLLALNELGAFLWERIPTAETGEDLLAAVLEAYEVEEDRAREDIAGFLGKLSSLGILEV